MSKRKARKEDPGKQDASVPRKERPRLIGLKWLPDTLIEKVISYNRPKEDETEPFWQWLCQMSATCPAFRRVVLSSTRGSSPLTPSTLDLDDENDTEGYFIRLVNLMDTITTSDWMGANIRCVRVQVTKDAVADALSGLLCGSSPCLPQLEEVYINGDSERWDRYFDSHLLQLAKIHPNITSLFLPPSFLYGRTSPDAFASAAKFLPNLKRFGFEGVNTINSEHIIAFLSMAGQKLAALAVSYSEPYIFESIASHCHNLDTLILKGESISGPSLANILQSTPNLVHLELIDCVTSDGVLDAIIEWKPKLKTFRVQRGNLIDDDGLMRLFDRQIEAGGGKMSLTTLGISEGAEEDEIVLVTTYGLSCLLHKWKDTNPILPLTLEIIEEHEEDLPSRFIPMIDYFPEVTFDYVCFGASVQCFD